MHPFQKWSREPITTDTFILEVLEIERDATKDEIRQAYRKARQTTTYQLDIEKLTRVYFRLPWLAIPIKSPKMTAQLPKSNSSLSRRPTRFFMTRESENSMTDKACQPSTARVSLGWAQGLI